MHIPPLPPVGHVIAYEYLWLSQASSRDDGAKTYPAAIVLARRDIGPTPVAYVLGISHSSPQNGRRAIEVPRKLKRYLGLDELPSWIYTDEVNVFAWPGPDLRPAEHLSRSAHVRGTCVIGALPSDWFAEVINHMAESQGFGNLTPIKRSE